MNTVMRQSFVSLAVGAALVLSMTSADAGSPNRLSDRQLDRVTAGGAIVVGSSDAAATGALAIVATTGNSYVYTGQSPYAGNPGLDSSFGAVVGTALAVGTNLGNSGAPPPSSGTSVSTAGMADGNLVMNSTINQTIQGAGGVTFQAGWTVTYGAWIGL